MAYQSIRIPFAFLNLMRVGAATAYPEEACGLIVGRRGAQLLDVTRIEPARNVAEGDRRRRFVVDPQAHFRLLRSLRGTGEEVVGVYHSHPDGRAEPSPADAEMALEADFAWLIVGIDPEGETDIGSFAATGAPHAAFRRVRLLMPA